MCSSDFSWCRTSFPPPRSRDPARGLLGLMPVGMKLRSIDGIMAVTQLGPFLHPRLSSRWEPAGVAEDEMAPKDTIRTLEQGVIKSL